VCWGEYEALEPFLDRLGTPSKVLDIGPGLGRSTIFFKKIRNWETVPFHLYEGSGETTNYTKAGARFDDSFCGNIDALKHTLEYNEVSDFEIFDAPAMGSSLEGLPGGYDFIYSFFAIGFHWAIEHFLEEILAKMTDRAIGAFTLHDRYTKLHPSVEQLPHRIVEFRGSWPQNRWRRILVLAKAEDALG
jgi:SAM-dependent methyltransferase